MKSKNNKLKKENVLTGPIKPKNYVLFEGEKISRTWAAALANKGTGKILNMRAVLK